MYELLLNLLGTLLITLIGVFGAWLMTKIGKRQELSNIAAATEQVILAAQLTVGELQQTVVSDLKAKGGKLTNDQISMLGRELIEQSNRKISAPVAELLEAANVDVKALIIGAGEDLIGKIGGKAE